MKILSLKYLASILILISSVKTVSKYEALALNKECLIRNTRHTYSYLYPASISDFGFWNSRREVQTWLPSFFFGEKEFTVNNKQGVWILKRIIQAGENVYLIQNEKFQEYLYATDKSKIFDLISDNRPIYTDTSKKFDKIDEKFMWHLKKLKNGLYEIWNVRYKEGEFYFVIIIVE